MSELIGHLQRHPSPIYLLGAMIEDDVPTDLALRIATAYRTAQRDLDDDQVYTWLKAMLVGLINAGNGGASTFIAVLACPSDHQTGRYEALASSAGWEVV